MYKTSSIDFSKEVGSYLALYLYKPLITCLYFCVLSSIPTRLTKCGFHVVDFTIINLLLLDYIFLYVVTGILDQAVYDKALENSEEAVDFDDDLIDLDALLDDDDDAFMTI